MKKYIKYIIVIAFISGCAMTACSDWTDVEADEFDIPGKSEEYYANLRQWKATYEEREVSFGWFGGWTGTGASMVSSLAGLPDSIDMVSIWGDWKTMTDAKKKDLEYAQKVLGIKVLSCAFAENVGDGFTPDGVTVAEYWGWDPNESGLNAEPTENQKAALRKYARAIADATIERGYDGFDMDHEPNYGGAGDLASSRPRLYVFLEELSKYFGPKSGTNRVLAVDGEPQSIPAEAGPFFNWFIVQAYDCTSYTNLNTRLNTTIRNYTGSLTPQEVAKKYIVTENFEKAAYNTTGGANFLQEDGTYTKSYLGMSAWKPAINGEKVLKGGAGVYHIEYAYSVNGFEGFYPFTRESIRIMNPAN